jgi:uncharacterized membrane protein YgdD (TMEM256/DUF423 family)
MPSPTDTQPTDTQNARSGTSVLFAAGAFLAAAGVALGAFATHALEPRVPAGRLETFQTGARYHLAHAVAILVLATAAGLWNRKGLIRAGWMLVAGTALFSGSLYLLVLTDTPAMGAVTPFGGVLLIGGWLWAGIAMLRRQGGSAR